MAAPQSLMEDWYGDLSRDHDRAAGCFDWDYSDLGELLAPVRGTVVDIGGGLGLARDSISGFDGYLIVEPSLSWLDDRWGALEDRFPCLRRPVDLVRGIGELLPLRRSSFDACLALWSLNHAAEPKRVLEEAYRVLRPDGYLIAILEDITPTDADIDEHPELGRLCEGDVQPDHLHISESDFAEHSAGLFEQVERRWMRHYLGLVVRKVTSPDGSRTMGQSRAE